MKQVVNLGEGWKECEILGGFDTQIDSLCWRNIIHIVAFLGGIINQ